MESAGMCLLCNIQMDTNEFDISAENTQIFVYKKVILARCYQLASCY